MKKKCYKKIKIAVDCRMLNRSGIGVYLKNVLYYWLQSEDISWTLIGIKEELLLLPLNDDCNIVECDIPIFSFNEMIKFPVSKVNNCDIFYSPSFNIPIGIKIPIYITIHDVVFLDVEDLTSSIGLLIRKFMIRRAMKIARKIFTVSEFSKERIIYHFGNCKDIIVANNGLRVDLLNHNFSQTVSLFDFEYILFIGNIKKYKGLDVLLDAIKKTDIKLVIVGSIKYLKTSDKIIFEKIRFNKKIVIYDNIRDEMLYDLIIHAKSLVQPSRYEGFGIPPLESLYLGTPAIISDIPVFKEIYGNMPVVFFRDGDAEDLKSKLEMGVYPIINSELIKNRYSYKETAIYILNQMIVA
ncbi:MAG: glycosyltransferase family 1 protein [Paludibacter sp.]|nr:glycosyltransferase family 1 protein [Paludibacter sp.]